MNKLCGDLDYRVPSACGITGIMDASGELFSGDSIYASICNMRERGNGLGAGFAAYGIYPDFRDFWCFHIMYQQESAKELTENYLKKYFKIRHFEPIPTRKTASLNRVPILYRYFLVPDKDVQEKMPVQMSDEEVIVSHVMYINRFITDAFVFSSGRNMGIFKGVGHPDEIGEFFRIPDYRGYIWIAHNRFPTNSVGWWGGAHPFGLLDWSVIHNGEISSYGINKRYLENFGYFCTLNTDTEVITYLFDLLVRKHGIDLELAGGIMAAPFWLQIERVKEPETAELLKTLRIVYAQALVNGPFGIIVANQNFMVGLNDRIKLRPLVAASKGSLLYIASEESAIRCVCSEPDMVWMPRAGEPTVCQLRKASGREKVWLKQKETANL